MENIIRQIVLDLGFTPFNAITENQEQNRRVVNILEHSIDDINFIQEQMLQNIDILIIFDNIGIAIVTRNNNPAILLERLQQAFGMRIFEQIEPLPHFNFRVTYIR